MRGGASAVPFHQSAQAGEPFVPLRADLVQPGAGAVERFGAQGHLRFAALPAPMDQPRALQHVQMLGHRLPAERQPVRQPGDGRRAAIGQSRQQAKPRRVAQGGEKDRRISLRHSV